MPHKRIGLISDTHIPERWNEIPAVLPDIFAGVSLILHAGDVGELWALDHLSQIAPVIAVHGNDEPQVAFDHLPLSQIVTVAGLRILLWHSHYTDRVDEMESRRQPEMRPKLERIARYGHRAGASLVHFGHWHVPVCCEIEGVTLVNAGGIASGNYITRQQIQTAAVLTLEGDGRFDISHYNLADGRPYHAPDISDTTFAAAAAPYIGSILSPDLEDKIFHLHQNPVLFQALKELAPRCWYEGQDRLTTADFTTELKQIVPRTAEIEDALALLLDVQITAL